MLKVCQYSIVSLCLHSLLTGCHAGHMIIRGAYNEIDILARLPFLWAVIQAKDLILSDLVVEGPMRT